MYVSSQEQTTLMNALIAEGSPTHCNNTSVGMIVERGGKYLLFRRVKKPWGHAPSAGHVDELPFIGHPDEVAIYEQAAKRELQEETGLIALHFELVLVHTFSNQCRRIGGDWHKWRVYRVQIDPNEQPRGKADESQDLIWYWPAELAQLAARTRSYLAGQISESEWEAMPGLEVAWLDLFSLLSANGYMIF